MDQKWMAMLGAAGFIAMILTAGHTMIYLEGLREKRRKRGQSPTPPPARH